MVEQKKSREDKDEVAAGWRIREEDNKIGINASEQPTLKVALKHIKLNLKVNTHYFYKYPKQTRDSEVTY